jgi:DNA-binding NtrC family response regulator
MATKNALARRALQSHTGPETPGEDAIGTDFHGFFIAGKTSLQLAREARKLANYFAFMMVSGPEGSGKSEWVRAMHAISDRSAGSLEMLDCKTVSRTSVAREVFGFMEGAGASSAYQPGCLKRADGGILWLKDMETLPEYVQTHLSEYMDSGILLIPGLPEDEFLDAKLIATTRLDFRDENVRNRFSNQFLRRLSILNIHVPGLAERRDEIMPMAHHLLGIACAKRGRPAPTITPEVINVFQNYPWERNITEMIEVLEHCLDRCKTDTLVVNHLPAGLQSYHSNLSYVLAQDTASRLD